MKMKNDWRLRPGGCGGSLEVAAYYVVLNRKMIVPALV